MKASTIRWHLARDNQLKLARFCEKHAISSETKLNTYQDDEHTYWQKMYKFDNEGYVVAELLQGDTKSYSVADHFQVVRYRLGQA